jgi:hypothetical protein
MSYSDEFINNCSKRLSLWLGSYTDFKNSGETNEEALSHLPCRDSWEFQAIAAFYKTSLRGASNDNIKNRPEFYTLGYTAGFVENVFDFVGDDVDEVPEELFELINLPPLLKEMLKEKGLQGFPAELEKAIRGATLNDKADYYEGLSDGMRAISNGNDLRYESNASEAYGHMLLHSEQIGMLESWKEFHAFIYEEVKGYEGRFDACKKMGQAVGYSPRNESSKKRAKKSGGA